MNYLISLFFSFCSIFFCSYIYKKNKHNAVNKIFIIYFLLLFQLGIIIKLLLIYNFPNIVLDNIFYRINGSNINFPKFIYVNIISIIFFMTLIYVITLNIKLIKGFTKLLNNNIYKLPIFIKIFNINPLFLITYLIHILLLYISFKYAIGLHGLEYKINLPPLIGGLIVYIRNYVLPSLLVAIINLYIFDSNENILKKLFVFILFMIDILIVTFVETSKVFGLIMFFSAFGPPAFNYISLLFKKIHIISVNKLTKVLLIFSSLIMVAIANLRISTLGGLFRNTETLELNDFSDNSFSIVPFLSLISRRVEGAREIILNINSNISYNPFNVFFFDNPNINATLYPYLNYSEGNMGITYGLFGFANLTDNLIISSLYIIFISLIINIFINQIRNFNLQESTIYFLSLNSIILFWGGPKITLVLRLFLSIIMIGYFNKYLQFVRK